MVIVEVLDDLERLELMLGGKAVAALGLDRGGAEAHHLVERLGGLGGELLLAGLTGGVRRGLDAAARVLNVEIACAVELETQLVLRQPPKMRWVWASTRPGVTRWPSASTTSAPSQAGTAPVPTEAMMPSSMSTHASFKNLILPCSSPRWADLPSGVASRPMVFDQ